MSLGPMEIVLIVGIALLFFGPSRLPGLGKSVGEAIRGFKKAMDGKDEEPPPSRESLTSSQEDPTAQTQKDRERSE